MGDDNTSLQLKWEGFKIKPWTSNLNIPIDYLNSRPELIPAESFAESFGNYLKGINVFQNAATSDQSGVSPVQVVPVDNTKILSDIKMKNNSGWTEKGWVTLDKDGEGTHLSTIGGAALGSQVAGGISNYLALGNETTVGNALNGLGNVAAAIPGPYGALASGILKTTGGLTNAIWGSKINLLFVNLKRAEIANVGTQTSQATNSDAFARDYNAMNTIGNFTLKDVGTDGWASRKAKNLFNTLQQASGIANLSAKANYNLLAENINLYNTETALTSYAALGGLLYSRGGILFDDYGNLRKYKDVKDKYKKATTPKYEVNKFYDVDEDEYQQLLKQGYNVKIVKE